MKISEQKKQLRKRVGKLKMLIPDNEREHQSSSIFKKIEILSTFKNANNILLYWSMNDEVATHNFAQKWYKTKNILLPVVDGKFLKIRKFDGMRTMQKGEQFGILEPVGLDFTEWENIEIIIVPVVAFDKNNNRMGRGRGYYDKLLAKTNALKIGVCFDFQFFDIIPIEEHDLPMDFVVTV